MIGEGFDIERPGGGEPAPQDPGRVAREAADRIAQQVREVLQSAEERAAEIRSRAEADAEAIRRDAAGAAARMLENVERLEDELEQQLTGFFDSVRREIEDIGAIDQRRHDQHRRPAARPIIEQPRRALLPEQRRLFQIAAIGVPAIALDAVEEERSAARQLLIERGGEGITFWPVWI